MLPLKSNCRTQTHQEMLCDKRVWCGLEQCWAVLWIFERTVGSGSLNIPEPKNRLLQFFEKKFKIEESSVLVLSKTSTNWWFSWKNRRRTGDSLAGSLTLKKYLRTVVIPMPKSIIWKIWELAGKWIYRQDDNQQYPSSIQRTNEYWFGPMLVCPYISGEPQTQFQNLYVHIYII